MEEEVEPGTSYDPAASAPHDPFSFPFAERNLARALTAQRSVIGG